MRVTWFGIACIRLESKGQSILFDPFIRRYGNMEAKLISVMKKEKVVLVTHGHFDHIADIGRIYHNEKDTMIYATKTPFSNINQDGIEKEHLCQICPGKLLHLNGFDIHILEGKHIQFDTELVLKTIFNWRMIRYGRELLGLCKSWRRCKENDEILFYEVHAEEKIIQLMGSAALNPNGTYRQHADLLIMAYQGRSDIADHCMDIVNVLQPKKIMLSHFDDAFPPISRDVDTRSFCRMMKQKYPDVEVMTPQLDLSYEI